MPELTHLLLTTSMRGKTIKLFLCDGTPGGVVVAELMNWTGKVFVVPRPMLAQVRTRPELQRAGAYILIGDDPDVLGRLRVYIGEAESLIARVPQHDASEDKAFYDRVVFITGKDDFLTKSHARWLEKRLIGIVKANGSVSLANGTNGGASIALAESDESDMEGFMDHVTLVLPALGFPFTQAPPSVEVAAKAAAAATDDGSASTVGGAPTSPVFELTIASAVGRAQEVGGQFFLMSGSTCRRQGVPAWTSYKALRERLVSEGKIMDGPTSELLTVSEDIPLRSPSAGAAIIAGSNMNGRIAWKTNSGQTYQGWVDGQALLTGGHPSPAGTVAS